MVEQGPNSWSSSAPTTGAPSRSYTTTSASFDSTQWSSLDAQFSALSYAENISWSLPSATITNWLLVDVAMALSPVYERASPMSWMDQAKCHFVCANSASNLFYADHQHNGQVNEAKAVCLGTHPDHPGRCPVLDQCLDYALSNGEKWGVWGGCSERERRKIKRDRHREAALDAGNIISITAAPSRNRRQLARIIRNQQAADPAPWRHSKSLIDQRRQRRAAERRAASFGDVALGMVSQG